MKPLLPLAAVVLLAACNNPTTQAVQNVADTAAIENTLAAPPPMQMKCYMQAINQDTTWVTLTILADTVTGTMKWRPFLKDGAMGSLRGLIDSVGQMHLLYDYIIEGNKQTETKTMKIENDSLFIKHGPLVDENNNGHLKYKDEATAVYTEVLPQTTCK